MPTARKGTRAALKRLKPPDTVALYTMQAHRPTQLSRNRFDICRRLSRDGVGLNFAGQIQITRFRTAHFA
jgi:hypothetical protein